jgi:hypothetical protein
VWDMPSEGSIPGISVARLGEANNRAEMCTIFCAQ